MNRRPVRGMGVRAGIIKNGFLYVSDYGLSQLDRFQYTYDQTANTITAFTLYGIGNNTTNVYFLGGSVNPVKEGVHRTATDLIIVGGNPGTGVTNISRYALDGTRIGTIPINFSRSNGGNVGIGNVPVTPDGKYMYVPLEAAVYIVKANLANGNVSAANYANASARIIVLDANLTKLQNLVTAATSGAGGSFRPSGLSIAADGSLSATLDTPRSYSGSATLNLLEFTFGNNVGPDGNLYIAALGGSGFSVKSGYKDGIYKSCPAPAACRWPSRATPRRRVRSARAA